MYIHNYLSAVEYIGEHQMDKEKNNKWTVLAGFEPITICFRDCFKMPQELGGEGQGFQMKIIVLDSDLPLPLLSFRTLDIWKLIKI